MVPAPNYNPGVNRSGVFLTDFPWVLVPAGARKVRNSAVNMVDMGIALNENTQLRSRGGVPEWPKGSDCKSDGSAFGGSNPPPSTIYFEFWCEQETWEGIR